MPYSDGLRQLATVVELLEAVGTDVVDARPCEVAGDAGDQFRVELRLDLPLESDLSLPATPEDRSSTAGAAAADREAGGTDATENDADGTPAAAAEAPRAPSADTATGSDGDSADESDGDECVPCRAPECDRTFDGEHGMKIHFSKTHVEDGADGPAYRDPDRLREAYAATDGFAAMREYLDAGVSTETIRRYAIEHGIHDRDPAAGSDGSDGSVPEPPAIDRAALAPAVRPVPADDASVPPTIDRAALAPAVERAHGGPPTVPNEPADRPAELDEALPPGLTVPELKATVREADTLYQVAAELDLDRERARALLRDLDLLDLVHGRVATKRRRDELKSEIDRRLQKNAESALSS